MYDVKLRHGSIEVPIAATKVEQDLDNQAKTIEKPVMIRNQGIQAPTTIILDLKRVKEAITINGYLLSDATSTALEKKQALISRTTLPSDHPLAPNSIGILHKKGNLTLIWRGEEIECGFGKIKIIDSAEVGELPSSAGRGTRGETPQRYEIILMLIVGEVQT